MTSLRMRQMATLWKNLHRLVSSVDVVHPIGYFFNLFLGEFTCNA